MLTRRLLPVLPLVAAVFVALGVAVAGCATAPAPGRAAGGGAAPAPAPVAPGTPLAARAVAAPAAVAAKAPTDFKALLAREASGLTAHRLEIPGGKLTGSVDAKGDPVIQRQDKALQISIPIGSDLAISCYLFDEPIDAAASLVRFVRLARQGAQGITVREIVPSDAGAIGETAYLMATLAYTKPSAAGLMAGQVKMFARPDRDASLLCLHDEVGYGATFRQVTHGLARALAPVKPGPAPSLVEIQVSHLGELPVGFERRTVSTDASGLKVDQTISSVLMPRSPDELNAIESVATERSDAAGRILQIDSIEVEGDEVASQISLKRQGTGREYLFTGKHSGKDISGRFKSKEKEGLPSSLLVASRLRAALLGGKSSEIKVEEYHGDLSPQAPLEVVYRRKGATGRDVTLRLGQLEASGRLDERGMVEQVSLPVGATSMHQERILFRGSP